MKRVFILLLFTISFVSCTSSTRDTDLNLPNRVLNQQPTGSSANDILASTLFTKLVIEVAYMDGFKPTDVALSNFRNFILSRVHKTEGVEFVYKKLPFQSKSSYTLDEVVAIENNNRTNFNTNSTIAVWVLFINGEAATNTNNQFTLGSAYWNTSFVIYQETIQNLSNSAFDPSRSDLETTVINHEFGHLLGLTNLGTPMQTNHEDTNHPKHCNNENCLMYWAAETNQGVSNMLSGGNIPQLDAQCLNDLKANGGK